MTAAELEAIRRGTCTSVEGCERLAMEGSLLCAEHIVSAGRQAGMAIPAPAKLGKARVRLTFALDVDLDAWAAEYGLDPTKRAQVLADARGHVAVLVGDAVVERAALMGTFEVAP